MQVIVLAAGMGLRLGHLTQVLPKSLILAKDIPLIDYTLSPLLADKRVEEVCVVGGFAFDRLKKHLEEKYSLFGDRLNLIENKDFQKGNLYSLLAALDQIQNSFLICNADHLYDASDWKNILEPQDKISILADFKRPLLEDEMKIQLNPRGFLQSISKQLSQFEAGYIGLTYIPQSRLELYKAAVKTVLDRYGEKAVVEQVLHQLAAEGESIQIRAFDKKWWEVDTPEDLRKAEAELRAKQNAESSISREKQGRG